MALPPRMIRPLDVISPVEDTIEKDVVAVIVFGLRTNGISPAVNGEEVARPPPLEPQAEVEVTTSPVLVLSKQRDVPPVCAGSRMRYLIRVDVGAANATPEIKRMTTETPEEIRSAFR